MSPQKKSFNDERERGGGGGGGEGETGRSKGKQLKEKVVGGYLGRD